MNKALKWILICIGIILIGGYIAMRIMKHETKKYSPEDTITYMENGLDLELFYNRPYKKDRNIFGGLVPYNETWRTGANEQTTFTTKTPILVDGSKLVAGEYSLFTVPKKDSWEIVFNNKAYTWGVNWKTGKASRLKEFDELVIEVHVSKNYKTVEQFTISFQESNDMTLMLMAWDDVVVSIPITSL